MTSPPEVMECDRSVWFELSPPALWAAIEQFDRFERWWGWLGDFRVDGEGLRPGTVLHGTVSPPVPYRMRVQVVLEVCRAPRSIEAAVHGDLEGHAELTLTPAGDGSEAHVRWTIEMMQRPMRIAAHVAPRLLHWGHDRVVDVTVASFRRQLARLEPPDRSRQSGDGKGQGHRDDAH